MSFISLQSCLSTYLAPTSVDWRINVLRSWPDLVGALSQRMQVERIDGALIVVGVYDSHWMHELFMMSRFLTKTINQKLGGDFVGGLKFVLSSPKKERAKKQEKMRPKTVEHVALSFQQQKALSIIKDIELRSLLHSFLARCVHNVT